MANEIQLDRPDTLAGSVLYAHLYQGGRKWNVSGGALETPVAANYPQYAVTLAESGTSSGFFVGSIPAGMPAGPVEATVYQRAGGTPAAGDTPVATTVLDWDGSALASVGNRLSRALAVSASGGVAVDLAQAVPVADLTAKSSQTVGDCLSAARADGAGKWAVSGSNIVLYGPDGTTVVRTFTLDSPTNPTRRS